MNQLAFDTRKPTQQQAILDYLAPRGWTNTVEIARVVGGLSARTRLGELYRAGLVEKREVPKRPGLSPVEWRVAP